MIRKLAILAFAAAGFCSCLSEALPGTEPKIDPGADALTVPADFSERQDTVITLQVRSNRSWFAHFNDSASPVDPSDASASVDWAELNISDHENLTKVEDITELELRISRNRARESRDGVLNFWFGGGVFASVQVHQQAAVYRLAAEAASSTTVCSADSVAVVVRSNTCWSAEVQPSSTADISLSKSSGTDTDTLYVRFDENFEFFEKVGVVTISAEGCEPCTITITQGEAVPYLILDDVTGTRIPSDLAEWPIRLKTNCSDVQAAFRDSCELADAVIEKVSDREFLLKFTNQAGDPVVDKKAKIVFSAPNSDELVVEFTHNPLLQMNFLTDPCPATPLPTKTDAEESSHTLTVGEHSYEVGLKAAFFRADAKVLVFYKSSYIAAPAIEGYTLRKFIITFRGHTSNNKAKVTVKGTGADAATLYSKANISLAIPTPVNDYVTHEVVVGENCENQPAPGVSYRICQGSSYIAHIRNLAFMYEKD